MIDETTSSANAVPAAIGLRDVMGIVRRQHRLIIVPAVVVTLLAAIVLAGIAPRYSAEALLMIDSRTSNPANLEMMIGGLGGDRATIMSEIELLTSTNLVEKVIEEMNLGARLEFNEALRRPGLFARLLGSGDAAAVSDSGAADAAARVRVIETFRKRLRVEARPDSRVVSVMFTSEDPQTAADVANTVSELYLQDQLESKFESLQLASAWLNERVVSLRSEVQASEQQVEEFRERSGLLQGGGMTLTDHEVSQLNSELIAARTARAAAEVQLDQVRELLTLENGAERIGDVIRSPLIQTLREQQVGVLRLVAESSTVYGDKHPTMVKLRADAADLEAKINAEIAKIVGGLESDFQVARGREAAARAALSAAKARVGKDNKSMVTLRSLERESEANRLLLETVLARFTEASAVDDIASQRADARIISRALLPAEPSFPMSKAILAVVFTGSGFIGLMLAFAQEFLAKGFRSSEQLESVTGLQSLGIIPRVSSDGALGSLPADYLLVNPISAYSESIRSLFVSISRAKEDGDSYSLLVTSCQTEEGKSTVAASLARTIAKAGKRVIIIDADCRNPTIGRLLGIDREEGLTNILNDNASLADVVVTDEASGADVLCAGPAPGDPPAMFASRNVRDLLALLAEEYEYVILDSPPTMAVSDAVILSGIVDGTLLVARWNETRQESVVFAARQLTNASANLIGAVLTVVDVKKFALYGYGDSGVYSGNLDRYYHRPAHSSTDPSTGPAAGLPAGSAES